MRNQDLGVKGGKAAAANGARPVAKKRRRRRRWSAEEKLRIARESFATSESVTAVEERASVPIEGRGVTVRLEGAIDTAGIASIAVALAGSR